MVRIGSVAAALGVAAGVWLVVGVSLGIVAPDRCGSLVCVSNGPERTMVQAVSVLLILGSLACFVGPRRIFYFSAGLSVTLGALILASYVFSAVATFTLVLIALNFILSLIAARSEFRVSEQSNPMNLPVFG